MKEVEELGRGGGVARWKERMKVDQEGDWKAVRGGSYISPIDDGESPMLISTTSSSTSDQCVSLYLIGGSPTHGRPSFHLPPPCRTFSEKGGRSAELVLTA